MGNSIIPTPSSLAACLFLQCRCNIIFHPFSDMSEEESDLPPKLRAQVVERRQRNAAGLENILREGVAQGVFRVTDTRLIVHAMLGMCAWLHKWHQPAEERLEDVTAAFLGLIEKGCLAP